MRIRVKRRLAGLRRSWPFGKPVFEADYSVESGGEWRRESFCEICLACHMRVVRLLP